MFKRVSFFSVKNILGLSVEFICYSVNDAFKQETSANQKTWKYFIIAIAKRNILLFSSFS